MVPFDRPYATFYWSAIINMPPNLSWGDSRPYAVLQRTLDEDCRQAEEPKQLADEASRGGGGDANTEATGRGATIQRQITPKWYKIELYLQWRTNRKLDMVYRTAPFSMTLTPNPRVRFRVSVGKGRKPYPNFQMIPLLMTLSDL